MDVTTLEIAAQAERFARRRLRPAVVVLAEQAHAVLREVPGLRSGPADQLFLESLAWLHVAVDSAGLGEPAIRTEGFPEHLIMGARLLRRAEWMTDHWYSRQIVGAPELVRIVFVAVELAGLLVTNCGADERQRRVVSTRADHWVIPIAEDLGAPWGPWLVARLREGIR